MLSQEMAYRDFGLAEDTFATPADGGQLVSSDELRAKLAALQEVRAAAKRELEALKDRREEVEELERDRDALLEQYAAMVPEGLDAYSSEVCRWAYKLIRLNVFADQDGGLSATWMFDRMGVLQENAHRMSVP